MISDFLLFGLSELFHKLRGRFFYDFDKRSRENRINQLKHFLNEVYGNRAESPFLLTGPLAAIMSTPFLSETGGSVWILLPLSLLVGLAVGLIHLTLINFFWKKRMLKAIRFKASIIPLNEKYKYKIKIKRVPTEFYHETECINEKN